MPVGTHAQQEADHDECDDQGRTAAQLQTRRRVVGTGDSCEWGGMRDEGESEQEVLVWPAFCLKHGLVCFLIRTGLERLASSKPSLSSRCALLAPVGSNMQTGYCIFTPLSLCLPRTVAEEQHGCGD